MTYRADSSAQRTRLPQDVERALVLAAQRGNKAAREELVEAFVPLVGSVARIYRGSRAVDRVELMQEGVVGLLRALERYDPAGNAVLGLRVLVGAPGDATASSPSSPGRWSSPTVPCGSSRA